jgi:hypothetical protein
MAQLLIHRLREQLTAFLPAPLHQRWPHCLFLRPDRSFWALDHAKSEQEERAAVAGGSWSDGWASPEALPTTQVHAGQARHPARNRPSVHRSLTGFGLLRTSQHGHNFAGQSDDPPRRGRSGTTHVGHRLANTPRAGSCALVAGVFSLCTPSCLAARGPGLDTRRRWDSWEVTVSTAD